MKTGNQVTVISDMTTIEYEDGTRQVLRKGAIAGAFSDFVTSSPDGGEGVEVFANHPDDGKPTTAVVSADRVQIFNEEQVQKLNYVSDAYGNEPGIYTLEEFLVACLECFGEAPELTWQTDGTDEWYIEVTTGEIILTTAQAEE